jgi:site-specific DNA-cytosine methylase/DNA modification methylase
MTRCDWDKLLPMDRLWEQYRRILKPTGNIVLTAAGMFTAKLMVAAPDLFKYSLVWEKTRATNFFHKDYRPLTKHEDVLVFSKGGMGNKAAVRPTYNPQGLVELDKPFVSRNGNTSNVWKARGPNAERGRYQTHTNWPTSVLRFASSAKVDGPAPETQKPIALMDWIIRTYSNPGDVVLDNCLGSGTTGIAALAAGRSFIGIELEPTFYEGAVQRIRETGPNEASVETEAPRSIYDRIMEGKRAAFRAAMFKAANDTGPRFATLCSGIESVAQAWEPLGYRPVFVSEVGGDQCKVLSHHYPTVPNIGDMTLIDGREWTGKLDVLWASTPCQSHSRNGKRAGLSDARGNLTLTAVKLADEIAPPVFVLENVTGILNVDNGETFGSLLAALVGEDQPLVPAGRRWTHAGAVCGPRRRIAWRTFDAQYAGLAQRRERVFLVACPNDGPDPCEIVFERAGPHHDEAELRELRAEETRRLAVGRSLMWFNGDQTPKWDEDVAYTLKANGGQNNLSGVMIDGEWLRLAPLDRERLMGLPDDWTNVGGVSDRSRNAMIGNAVAVPDARWLGERIKAALAAPRTVGLTGVSVASYRLAA